MKITKFQLSLSIGCFCLVGLSLPGLTSVDSNVSSDPEANLEANQPSNLECLAPAKPGGGFDLTCRLAANSLQAAGLISQPMQVEYMPGGIGAVAYNHVVGVRNEDPGLIVAASSGSALNLAQKKFGNYDENAVRWLAAMGADYGVIVVRQDAPWQNLEQLMSALQEDPQSIVIGAGGSIGSQDWMKAALLAKSVGIDPKQLRYVAFEGGGESLAALLGGQIQVFPGDVSELTGQLESGQLRVLAILADERLPDTWADSPTAKEQGYDVVWTIWRGYYLPPNISDEQYDWWVTKMQNLANTPEFKQEVAMRGLFPFTKIGEEYETFVKEQVEDYRNLAEETGLIQ